MNFWDNYKPERASRVEAGNYRCSVLDVEQGVSKSSGNDMFVITVGIANTNIKVKNYIVCNEYFNRNMTAFFESFGIDEGDFETIGWIGACGAAKFEEDENGYLKVKWFLNPKQAESLPDWQGERPQRQSVTKIAAAASDGFEAIDDDDYPFT